MKIRINTGLFPKLLDCSSYESDFANWYDSTKEMAKDVVDSVQSTLEDIFEDAGIKAKLKDFVFISPKEYNYYGDVVDFEIEVSKEEIKKMYSKFDEDFYGFIKDEYSSCSGFTSYMPTTRDEVENISQDELCRVIAMYLAYELQSDDGIYQRDFEENMMQTQAYAEYVYAEYGGDEDEQ